MGIHEGSSEPLDVRSDPWNCRHGSPTRSTPPPRSRPSPTEPDGRPNRTSCRSGRKAREVTDAPPARSIAVPRCCWLRIPTSLFTTIVLTSVARAADTQRPDGRVTVPLPDQTFSGPGPFILSGTATDDVGVTRADVAIKDRDIPAGGFSRTGHGGKAACGCGRPSRQPGALSTTWTYALSVPIGIYTVGFRAGDASRKFDASIPWVRFGVIAPPPPPPPPPPQATTDRPSVVLFLTDDQRWDSLWAMPNVLSLLGGHGVHVHQWVRRRPAVLPEPRSDPEGGVSALDARVQQRGSVQPIQRLRRFVDGGDVDARSRVSDGPDRQVLQRLRRSRAGYVPPGWDRWVAFAVPDVGEGGYTTTR